jgi:hypothetical protein
MTLLQQQASRPPMTKVRVTDYRVEKHSDRIFLSYKIDISRDKRYLLNLSLSVRLIDISDYDVNYRMTLEQRSELSNEQWTHNNSSEY